MLRRLRPRPSLTMEPSSNWPQESNMRTEKIQDNGGRSPPKKPWKSSSSELDPNTNKYIALIKDAQQQLNASMEVILRVLEDIQVSPDT